MTRSMKHTSVFPAVDTEAAHHAAAQKRAHLDNIRQMRILDPKVRTIGIDRQRLDEQVKEKTALRELEQHCEDLLNKAAVQQDKHAQALERESQVLRLEREKDLNRYRTTFQKREAGREWDLNDPKDRLHALPPRVADNDPRCGPASLQKFEGEDLGGAARRQRQAEQRKEWVGQQMDERRLKERLAAEEEDKWNTRCEEVAKRMWELDKLVAEQRAESMRSTASFNRKLAAQKREEAAAARRLEQQQNLEEIQNMLDSDFLGERRAASYTAKFCEKGLTHDQLQAIRNEQAQQREALRQQRIAAAETAAACDAIEDQQRAMALALEQQVKAERGGMNAQLARDLVRQHHDQAARQAETKRLYAPEIGEQFFKSFQTTTR
eukprot:Sspe_Gene.95198::Locus_67508_Transcript_1_1_Confidence_1.000_Length_1420::g.95198::m.95198